MLPGVSEGGQVQFHAIAELLELAFIGGSEQQLRVFRLNGNELRLHLWNLNDSVLLHLGLFPGICAGSGRHADESNQEYGFLHSGILGYSSLLPTKITKVNSI